MIVHLRCLQARSISHYIYLLNKRRLPDVVRVRWIPRASAKGQLLRPSLCITLLYFAFLSFALLFFAFLSFALLYFAFLSFTLLCFAFLSFAFLCFDFLSFAFLCFTLLCCTSLGFTWLYCTFLCFTLLCFCQRSTSLPTLLLPQTSDLRPEVTHSRGNCNLSLNEY